MTFGYGHIPDPPGHKPASLVEHLQAIGVSGPTTVRSVDMRAVVRVRDQSISGSCVNQSISGAINTKFARAGRPLAFLSGFSLYKLARMMDSPPGAPLVDTGCQPSQAFRAMHQYGIAAEADCPSSDPATVNDKPKLREMESADGFKFVGDYSIDGDQSTRVQLVTTALAANIPVTDAMIATQAFEDYTGGLYEPGGKLVGGHQTYCVGFYTQGDGSIVFIKANSWSVIWGLGGFYLEHEDHITEKTDMRAIVVEVAE